MSDQIFWIQTGIAALIAFAATFSGIAYSFRRDRHRKEKEETDHFNRMLQAMIIENDVNIGLLTGIVTAAKPGEAHAAEMQTEVFQGTLSSSLFHRRADTSLVHAAAIVRTELGLLNNVLWADRSAITGGHTTTDRSTTKLLIHAEGNIDRTTEMNRLLLQRLHKFGGRPEFDDEYVEVITRFQEITRKQNDRLAELAQTYTDTGGDAEEGDGDG